MMMVFSMIEKPENFQKNVFQTILKILIFNDLKDVGRRRGEDQVMKGRYHEIKK